MKKKSANDPTRFQMGSMEDLASELHAIYTRDIKPLEEMYDFESFKPSWFEETIVNQRPFVSFFGPWSAGKTTFINYLLQKNYLWTGPQPTTTEFTVIMYGETAEALDGRTLISAQNMPFKGLSEFGESFLQNFRGFQAPHPLLKRITLIDTPGVLEGTHEAHQRNYDYAKLSRWFTERSDLIFVLFDPTKLDAGKELRELFRTAFHGLEGKIRIVLNKADSINTQELMRVYGSLFWNFSNIISTTEPPRVYVGSFWDQPYKEGSFTPLFAEEKMNLLHELIEILPQQARDKKIASLICRAREVLVHVLIVAGMRSDMPSFFGKEKAKKNALKGLSQRYETIGAQLKMNHRDFPPVSEYVKFFENFDIMKYEELEKIQKNGSLDRLKECLHNILPGMIAPLFNSNAADPRDKDHSELTKLYIDRVRSQFQGKEGIQGSTDLVETSLRPVAISQDILKTQSSVGHVGATTPSAPSKSSNSAPTNTPVEANAEALMAQMMLLFKQHQQQNVASA